MKAWFAIPLWQRVIGALILGVALGLFWGPESEAIKWIGDFFIKAIKMLVVPLIFFSLVAGVASIGDIRKLGAVGGRALALFVVSGQIAVWLGLALGTGAINLGLFPSKEELGTPDTPSTTKARQAECSRKTSCPPSVPTSRPCSSVASRLPSNPVRPPTRRC